MPEANQYVLSHKELITLIIKASEIHEGRWSLLLNLGFAAGSFGPSESQTNPGVAVVISSIGIQRESQPGATGIIVDAAEVNPLPSEGKAAKPHKAKD